MCRLAIHLSDGGRQRLLIVSDCAAIRLNGNGNQLSKSLRLPSFRRTYAHLGADNRAER